MRHLYWIWMLSIGMAMACSGGCETKETKGTAPKIPEVRVGYFANLTHAQGVMGVESGELDKAVVPAKLTTRVFNAGPSLIEALFAGEIDIGYVGPGPAINAYAKSKGRGIRVIAGAAANGVVIIARKDAGINTLADLAGKRIATPQTGNTQDISARHYLQDVLKQTDLSGVMPIANSEQVAMMTRGQIDAAWVPEPWGAMLIASSDAKLIAEEKDLWPQKQVPMTLVVCRPEFLAEHPDVVERVLAVHRSWTSRLQKEPEKYVPELEKALFALTGKKMPAGVLAAGLSRVTFTDNPLEPALKVMADWSVELGFNRRMPNLAGLVDTAILQAAEERDKQGKALINVCR